MQPDVGQKSGITTASLLESRIARFAKRTGWGSDLCAVANFWAHYKWGNCIEMVQQLGVGSTKHS